MKIVQSLYTGSFINQNKNDLSTTATLSGYTNPRLYWYSWIRSLFSFLESGHHVQLVTDDIGKELLIDKLALPYSDVDLSLNEINPPSKKCWAIGKLKAYSIQREPFLHFDNDAFFVKPIPQISSPLFVQEVIERTINFDDWVSIVAKDIVLSDFDDIPEEIFKFVKKYKQNTICHSTVVGVIGGNDIELINSYSTKMYNFMFKNRHKIDVFLQDKSAIYTTFFMSFLEEQMLIEFHKEKYGTINNIQSPLGFTNKNYNYKETVEKRSKETGYVHFMSTIKNGVHKEAVDYRARFIKRTEDLYPEYCELVNIYLNN